jgi:hypothetical protein
MRLTRSLPVFQRTSWRNRGMKNKRNKVKASTVTFRFKGEKAAEIAEALFVQWLDGGMADQFEDLVHNQNNVDLVHDWDPNTLTFDIEVVPA